jgi:ferrous iron transport protein B
MELPAYHAPVPSNTLRATWERGWDFIKRAGTVIFAASVIIWTLNSLSFEGGFHYITETNGGRSILELLGSGIAWLFKPLGFGTWQAAIATILGLVAKEEVVGVFGTLANMDDLLGSVEAGDAAAAITAGKMFFSSALAGFSFLVFNLLCAPCFAAMGAIKREMNSGKWTAFAIGYMCVFAYAISLIIYQFGTWFIGGGNVFGTIFAVLALAVIVYMLVRKNKYVKVKS